MEAVLALEDGTVFYGQGFGAPGITCGEVVFNTGMTGYQEVLTDPSYCGQIVTMTYPLIGNYGINDLAWESSKPHVRGFVVKEFCKEPSNWQARETINGFLSRHRITGIAGVDTRALTRLIRTYGTMKGVVAHVEGREISPEDLVQKAREASIDGAKLVPSVTTPEPYRIPGRDYRVVVLDFGIKANILRTLQSFGCDLTVMPCWTSAEEIVSARPDGVFLSNGPGDPKDVPGAVETIKRIINDGTPVFGICLGHQLLSLALGANTYKLKFGHRGANHPVKDVQTGRVYITSQNHGYAVAAEHLPEEMIITHRNLNDFTVEGFRHKKLPVFGVQYHPEAAPGPEDSRYLFEQFIGLMKEGR